MRPFFPKGCGAFQSFRRKRKLTLQGERRETIGLTSFFSSYTIELLEQERRMMPPTKRSKNTRTAEEDTQGTAVQLQSARSVSPILGEIISMNMQQFREVFLTALRDELVKWEKECQLSNSYDSKKTLPLDSGSRIWKSIVKEAERFLAADGLVSITLVS